LDPLRRVPFAPFRWRPFDLRVLPAASFVLFITWNKSPEALTLLVKALLERQKRPAEVASVAGNLLFDVA
jgi:hypothetical protein